MGSQPPRLLRQIDYARRCGVNPSTVTRWIQNGRIRVLDNGLIDAEDADRQRQLTESPLPHHQARKAQFDRQREQPHLDDQDHGEGMESGEISRRLKLETYRLQKAKADQANLELDRSAGLLVERSEVEYLLADLAATLQSKLIALPALLAPSVASHRGDASAIAHELEGFARDLLTELASHIERQADAHLGERKT